jgi:hypothetical protein
MDVALLLALSAHCRGEAALHGISGGTRRIGSNCIQDVIRRNAAPGTPAENAADDRVFRRRACERIRPDGMYSRLGAAEERGADLRTRAQHQRRRHAARTAMPPVAITGIFTASATAQQRKQSDLPALRRSRTERTAMAAGLRSPARRWHGAAASAARASATVEMVANHATPAVSAWRRTPAGKPHDRETIAIAASMASHCARRNPAALHRPLSGTAGPHSRDSRTRARQLTRTGGGSNPIVQHERAIAVE